MGVCLLVGFFGVFFVFFLKKINLVDTRLRQQCALATIKASGSAALARA